MCSFMIIHIDYSELFRTSNCELIENCSNKFSSVFVESLSVHYDYKLSKFFKIL